MTKAQLEKAAAELAVPEWTEVPSLLEDKIIVETLGGAAIEYTFEEALQRRTILDDTKKAVEAELKSLNDALLVEMRAAELAKVKLWAGMTLEVRSGRSASKIEATKLLEAGVGLEVIQAATVEGQEYQYVQINRPKLAKGQLG